MERRDGTRGVGTGEPLPQVNDHKPQVINDRPQVSQEQSKVLKHDPPVMDETPQASEPGAQRARPRNSVGDSFGREVFAEMSRLTQEVNRTYHADGRDGGHRRHESGRGVRSLWLLVFLVVAIAAAVSVLLVLGRISLP